MNYILKNCKYIVSHKKTFLLIKITKKEISFVEHLLSLIYSNQFFRNKKLKEKYLRFFGSSLPVVTILFYSQSQGLPKLDIVLPVTEKDVVDRSSLFIIKQNSTFYK